MCKLRHYVYQSLRIYYEKEVSNLKQRFKKFTQDAWIKFVPLIPHFMIFVQTYEWNH